MIQPRLKGYEFDRLIGEGAMGAVFEAVQTSIGRRVAIKMIRPELVRSQALALDLFRQEARLQGMLLHPNVVLLFDFQETIDGVFIVQEFVAGDSLDHHIGRVSGPIPAVRAIPLFMQMLKGVGAAHEAGIIHRDLKPANILLTGDRQVKITDFGVAVVTAGASGAGATLRVGTPSYMAPEQVRGQMVDARTDVYALGITLFEMLTGRLPFAASPTSPDFRGLMERIEREPLPDPRHFYPHIPEHLVAAIQRATEKAPASRWDSCEEFGAALERCLADLGGPSTGSSRPWAATGAGPPPETESRRSRTSESAKKGGADDLSRRDGPAAGVPRSNSRDVNPRGAAGNSGQERGCREPRRRSASRSTVEADQPARGWLGPRLRALRFPRLSGASRLWLGLAVVFVAAMGLFRSWSPLVRLPYPDFATELEQNNVAFAQVVGQEIRGCLGRPLARDGLPSVYLFETSAPAQETDLSAQLRSCQVVVWRGQLGWIWPFLLLSVLLGRLTLFLSRNARRTGGHRPASSIGNQSSRNGPVSPTTKLTWGVIVWWVLSFLLILLVSSV